jgi:hypothetical protein
MQPILSRRFVLAVTQYREKPVGWCPSIDFPICAMYIRLAWIFCCGCAHTVYRTNLFISTDTVTSTLYQHRHKTPLHNLCFILVHQKYWKLFLLYAVSKRRSRLLAVLFWQLWMLSRRLVKLRGISGSAVCKEFLDQMMMDLCYYLTVREKSSGLFRV